MNKFWKKVLECKHDNISPDYYNFVDCNTDYCDASEQHCLDCGIYIIDCSCGVTGMSGWSTKRWNTHRRKKEKERNERRTHNSM